MSTTVDQQHSPTVTGGHGATGAEETAARDVYRRFMDAWNQGSGAALAEVFTEDGHLVAFDGTHFRRRPEIAAFHQQLFDKWLKGSRLVGRVEDVEVIGPELALMHAVGGTVMRGKAAPAPERDSIQTLVVTRRAGEWQLAAFQNTRLRPISRSAAAFLVWALSDWLWRVLRLSEKQSFE